MIEDPLRGINRVRTVSHRLVLTCVLWVPTPVAWTGDKNHCKPRESKTHRRRVKSIWGWNDVTSVSDGFSFLPSPSPPLLKGDAFIRLSLLPKDTATVCLNLLLSSWNKINKRKKLKSFKPNKWKFFLFAPLSSLGHITDDIFLHSCIRWAYKDRRGILKPASVAYGCIDEREIGLDKLGQCIKKQRHHFANKSPYRQSSGFSSHQVWMWELDHQEGWAPLAWTSEHWASWPTKQQQLFALTPLSLLRLHLSLIFHHRTATLHWTSVHGALWILYCLCEKYLGFWTCRVPGTFRGHGFYLIFKICHCGEVTAQTTELKNKPGFHGCHSLD